MADYNYHGPVVVFDLDDTLLREREFCRSGFRFLEEYVNNSLGFIPDNLFRYMNEALVRRESPFDVFETICRPLYESKGIKFELAHFINLYRSHTPLELSLIPGFEEVLDLLIKKGVKTGLITDGRSVTQRIKIKALNLERFICESNIWISEERGFTKETKEPFAAFVRKYPEASRFIYVGDNAQKDFYHANRLGWTTLQVPHHHDNVHPEVSEMKPLMTPDAVIDRPGDLLNHI